MKYNLSFEHTLHYLRRVRPVLDEFLQGNREAQAEALALILKAYHLDDLSTQDYDSDAQNLFQVRKKVVYLVLKLVDLGLLQASNLIPYCVTKISEHLANPDAAKLDQLLLSAQSQLVLSLMRHSQEARANVVARLTQETQKVAEVKIETPYEARVREEREKQAVEDGTAVAEGGGAPKEKTVE